MATAADHRDHLKNLLSNIQSLRSAFPNVLANSSRPLQPRPQPQTQVNIPTAFGAAFDALDGFEKLIGTQASQDAFAAAEKLPPAPAGQLRKRKRSEAESSSNPSTKRPSVQRIEISSTASWPTSVPSDPWPVDKRSLEEYIGHVNKQGVVRLQIWSRSKATQPQENRTKLVRPTYLRITIPDLLMAYMDIEEETIGDKSRFVVLLVTVFGVKEKKKPHYSSDFGVFARITQFFTAVLQAHPDADIPTIVGLISSFKNLYSEPCITCEQSWSMEGDLPPVHRFWISDSPSEPNASNASPNAGGHWAARHYLCSRSTAQPFS